MPLEGSQKNLSGGAEKTVVHDDYKTGDVKNSTVEEGKLHTGSKTEARQSILTNTRSEVSADIGQRVSQVMQGTVSVPELEDNRSLDSTPADDKGVYRNQGDEHPIFSINDTQVRDINTLKGSHILTDVGSRADRVGNTGLDTPINEDLLNRNQSKEYSLPRTLHQP